MAQRTREGTGPRRKKAARRPPLEEGSMADPRFIPSGDMEARVYAREQPDLRSPDIDHESIGALRGMEDGFQLWNAIVIVAHAKVLAGAPSFGRELEQELVSAIASLEKANISPALAGCLRTIASQSPNDLARAAARKKLEEKP